MNRRWPQALRTRWRERALGALLVLLVVSTACDQVSHPLAPAATPPTILSSAVVSPVALTCPAVGPVPAGTTLAARVNGQGIPLDLYNRQVLQAQTALSQQGTDFKTLAGQEALKSLRQQVLDQLIDDVVIALQAEKEGVKVTDAEFNARLAQTVQEAGGLNKLNDWLAGHQIQLSDLCTQLRSEMLGQAMLGRVTGALPTQVEQVHARQILMSAPDQAASVLDQLRAGKDFAQLARQNSIDEASKANGGDLGWFPKGVIDPLLEAAAFQIKPGQVSEVIHTSVGYHILKVEEHEAMRPLSPELLQHARSQAFLAWLQAVRETMKIERLVQP